MCTAISFTSKEHYFGRNLDLDRSYGEEVAVMPRKFPLTFRKSTAYREGYAIIGMATVVTGSETESYKEYGGLPLFYDAVNEHGLAIAGLNFPHNAYYVPTLNCTSQICSAQPFTDCVSENAPILPLTDYIPKNTATRPRSDLNNKYTVAPFEVIPWILRQCKTVTEAVGLMKKTTVADIPFSSSLPVTPLHWMLSDKEQNATVEPTREGLKLYVNPVGVLTNNPPFPYQLENLKKYRDLKPYNPKIPNSCEDTYSSYSYGLGALGLPGDVSSKSRFVRADFALKNTAKEKSELASVGQFFHLLSSVEVVKGMCKTDEGSEHFTVYSSCMNTERGIYYYTTYGNRQIGCIDMRKTELSGKIISRFELLKEENVLRQN